MVQAWDTPRARPGLPQSVKVGWPFLSQYQNCPDRMVPDKAMEFEVWWDLESLLEETQVLASHRSVT